MICSPDRFTAGLSIGQVNEWTLNIKRRERERAWQAAADAAARARCGTKRPAMSAGATADVGAARWCGPASNNRSICGALLAHLVLLHRRSAQPLVAPRRRQPQPDRRRCAQQPP